MVSIRTAGRGICYASGFVTRGALSRVNVFLHKTVAVVDEKRKLTEQGKIGTQ